LARYGYKMKYTIELILRAEKDLKNLPANDMHRVIEKLKLLSDGLQGDVKKLTNYTYEYRLRVGDWRVLFEVEKSKIVVYRILHRRESYR
jgi:mRNA interferase RelE/StbE